jgi:phospholipid/cholesterol/gamma-HCH transport system permease protein
MQAADFRIDHRGDGPVLALHGDWTAAAIGAAGRKLARALNGEAPARLDVSGLGRFDTAGAYALLEATDGRAPRDAFASRPDAAQVLDLVAESRREKSAPPRRSDPVGRFLVKVGQGVAHVGAESVRSLAFNGRFLSVVGRALVDPRRLRWPAITTVAEHAGLDALPIVAVTSFFVGAVVGFLGADLLLQFGASVFAVELVGIAVLREFAPLVTALLLAGRSSSSFAAEIGAMKMNQEIDAMQVLGVDPFEALVLPRALALLIMAPLLTFVAMCSGLFGGALVTWTKLDLSPAFFIQRIELNVGAAHFWVGLSKAPVFALIVAAIGCRQGMSVGGDVVSLGQRVTAAVVQAIFAIIVIDAIFALIYLEAGV